MFQKEAHTRGLAYCATNLWVSTNLKRNIIFSDSSACIGFSVNEGHRGIYYLNDINVSWRGFLLNDLLYLIDSKNGTFRTVSIPDDSEVAVLSKVCINVDLFFFGKKKHRLCVYDKSQQSLQLPSITHGIRSLLEFICKLFCFFYFKRRVFFSMQCNAFISQHDYKNYSFDDYIL